MPPLAALALSAIAVTALASAAGRHLARRTADHDSALLERRTFGRIREVSVTPNGVEATFDLDDSDIARQLRDGVMRGISIEGTAIPDRADAAAELTAATGRSRLTARGLLYIPRDDELPEPTDPGWRSRLADELTEALSGPVDPRIARWLEEHPNTLPPCTLGIFPDDEPLEP